MSAKIPALILSPSSNTPGATLMQDYIPLDLNDAVRVLKEELSKKDLEAIRKCANENAVTGLTHFTLGRGLRNSWGLWADSRLAQWFAGQRVLHPDEMSARIITALWYELNGKQNEFKLTPQA
jgi:hypothetical protein